MAKSVKHVTFTIGVRESSPPKSFSDPLEAVVKKIPIKTGQRRFLHVERKNDTFVVLNAMDLPTPLEIYPIRHSDEHREFKIKAIASTKPEFSADISALIFLKLEGQVFYFLDELTDGSWRVSYSQEFAELIGLAQHSDLLCIEID